MFTLPLKELQSISTDALLYSRVKMAEPADVSLHAVSIGVP